MPGTVTPLFPRPIHKEASKPAQSKTFRRVPGRQAPEACTPAPLRREGGAPLSQTRQASPTLVPSTRALGQQYGLGASGKAQTPEQEGTRALPPSGYNTHKCTVSRDLCLSTPGPAGARPCSGPSPPTRQSRPEVGPLRTPLPLVFQVGLWGVHNEVSVG